MATPSTRKSGADLLQRAQNEADSFSPKVQIGGKFYHVIVQQGGNLTDLAGFNEERVKELANTIFSSHKTANPTLEHKDIDFIDSKGIHFKNPTTSIISNETAPVNLLGAKTVFKEKLKEQKELLKFHETVSGKPDDAEIEEDIIPSWMLSKVITPGVSKPYSKDQIQEVVHHYLKAEVKDAAKLARNTHPTLSNDDLKIVYKGFPKTSAELKTKLEEYNQFIGQHTTALTAYEMMKRILFAKELEDSDKEFYSCEDSSSDEEITAITPEITLVPETQRDFNAEVRFIHGLKDTGANLENHQQLAISLLTKMEEGRLLENPLSEEENCFLSLAYGAVPEETKARGAKSTITFIESLLTNKAQ